MVPLQYHYVSHWVWLSTLSSLLDKHCKAAAYVMVYAELRVSCLAFSLGIMVTLVELVNQMIKSVAHLRNDFIFQTANKKNW